LEEREIFIPCGFTNALYAMTATTDEQMHDNCICSSRSHPTVHARRRYTNIHMNWDGIQGIELFEDSPAVLYEVAEKEFNRLRGICYFLPTVPSAATSW
jgi:hypothetical protein